MLRPILSWTSFTRASHDRLIILKEVTASSTTWTSPCTPFKRTPNNLHNKSSCPRNSHSEFVGVIILIAPTAVSATKRVLPSIHTAVGWEKQAERHELSFEAATPDPAIVWISIRVSCWESCSRTVQEPLSVKTRWRSFVTASPWTVWQSSDPFLTSLSFFKEARFNLVIPPSLLESATYSWLSSHVQPKGSEVSGTFMTKVTVPLRQAPLLVMATWYTPRTATSETMRRSEPTATRASGFFNSLSRGSLLTSELEHLLFFLSFWIHLSKALIRSGFLVPWSTVTCLSWSASLSSSTFSFFGSRNTDGRRALYTILLFPVSATKTLPSV